MKPEEGQRQLVLDLERAPRFDADSFLVSRSNAAAYQRVRAWPEWPGRTLLLIGPAGSGKSHLASIWANDQAAAVRRGRTPDPSFWAPGGRCLLLEDCDRAPPSEADLFHGLNLADETRGWILATARTEPSCWRVETPDLLSRLRRAPIADIGQPDVELLKAVMAKLFEDRQIRIAPDVIDYAARHCERSLDAVNRFVAAVDLEAMAEGRRITRPLAAKAIAAIATDG